jgi:hypothetical protein
MMPIKMPAWPDSLSVKPGAPRRGRLACIMGPRFERVETEVME